MAPSELVVTRFAPSPTGHLHIGGARSALFCWAYARRAKHDGHDGRFMIRIEDTDQARSSDESARGILDDMAWLGITWDDGPFLTNAHGHANIGGDARNVAPYFQAQRVAIYNAYVESLIKAGRAYPAFETSEELEVRRRAAVAAKQTYRYERPSDIQPGVFNAARWERAQKGESHVVRFVAPNEEIIVHDSILGDVKIAAGELDDLVIRKADGFPTYHFAVVIDDELMGVTHVLRAQEHLANTPRHVAMQKGLVRLPEHADGKSGVAFRTPIYGHMPVICNMDGSKMSKRDKAKTARKFLRDAINVIEKGSKQALIPQLQSITELSKDQLFRAIVAAMDVQQEMELPTNIEDRLTQVLTFEIGDSDSIVVANAVAKRFKLSLPEIEIWDFRRSGYLPEVIINFIALMGWNPGMKTDDGKDLEKFDIEFIGKHFSMDRIGKSSSKFDRNKLLSFNGDAIAAMPDDKFVATWRAWLAEYEPDALATLDKRGADTLKILAPAVKPRAKTLRDTLKPIAFALSTDTGYEFDAAAVEKNITGNSGAGAAILREFRSVLAALSTWNTQTLHGAIEDFAKSKGFVTEKGVNVGPVAQPLRVAIAGSAVSPPLGETLAVLGRESTLARIDRCLSQAP
jgi:glutamyl/glutaminyl-tRNA synthetase